jgi:hypothetical protein
MSDPRARLGSNERKKMTNFVYIITTTDGRYVRVTAPEGVDPTDHPTFYGRVLDVETLGEAGLSLV